jgi:outer membrane protein assembly factor BamD (BamD/ComL family)
VTPPHEPLPAVSAPSKPIKASIARETELLGAVQRALKVGRPSAALDALERYTEECPTGLLYEEATASRVVALCAVGRVQDGRRWADEFARRYPNSPLAPRVRGACPSVSAADASNGPVNE